MNVRIVLVSVLTLIGASFIVGGGVKLHEQYRKDRAILASPYP